MHQRPPRLLHELGEPVEGGVRTGRLEVDGGAVAPRRGELERAGASPHHDQAVDPLLGAGVRERLRVVPGRDRDHAAPALLGGQRVEPGEDAAGLERPGLLEELALQQDRRSHHLTQGPRREQRRAVDPAAEPASGALDVVERDRGVWHGGILGPQGVRPYRRAGSDPALPT